MNLSSSIDIKRSVFRKELKQIKETCCKDYDIPDDDSSSICLCCKKHLKTLYIDRIQTDFSISYESTFILYVNVLVPRLVYNNQEMESISIINEKFDDIDKIINRYYELDKETVKQLIEKKLKEYFVYHTDPCSLLGCENPGSSFCPRCSYCMCTLCLININMTVENESNFACPQCRFNFYR